MATPLLIRNYFRALLQTLRQETQEAEDAFNADGRPPETNSHTEQLSYLYLALDCVKCAIRRLWQPSPLPFDQRLGAVRESLWNSITRDPNCLNIGVSTEAGLLLDTILNA